MQSLISAILSAVALLTSSRIGISRTLNVPGEYATIQSAMSSLIENDTVLVDSGLYVEELIAPPFSFVLAGHAADGADSSSWPVVDPSALSGPTGRGCIVLLSGSVQISRFVFRNGVTMYPHLEGDVGGISIVSGNLSLTDCLFDSVYYGVYASGTHEAPVSLTRCRFLNSTGRCIFASQVVADSCSFSSDTLDWSQLTFGTNSVIRRCQFSGDFRGGNVLLGSGWNIRIIGCRFSNLGFAPGTSAISLNVSSSEISGNIFEDFQTGQSVLNIGTLCNGGPNEIRDNRFESIETPVEFSALSSPCISIAAVDDPERCPENQITDNLFVDCTTINGPSAIGSAGAVEVSHNRVVRSRSTNGAAVMLQDVPHEISENVFQENGVAVAVSEQFMTLIAERNYWGDSTGPFHPILNPDGHGDSVGDSVDFEPWLEDTTFWQNALTSDHSLPSTWRVAKVYPNPFNGEFRVELAGLAGPDFEVKLFDLLGREVALLHSGKTLGSRLAFDAPLELAAGVYFLRAKDHLHTETKKVLYLK